MRLDPLYVRVNHSSPSYATGPSLRLPPSWASIRLPLTPWSHQIKRDATVKATSAAIWSRCRDPVVLLRTSVVNQVSSPKRSPGWTTELTRWVNPRKWWLKPGEVNLLRWTKWVFNPGPIMDGTTNIVNNRMPCQIMLTVGLEWKSYKCCASLDIG